MPEVFFYVKNSILLVAIYIHMLSSSRGGKSWSRYNLISYLKQNMEYIPERHNPHIFSLSPLISLDFRWALNNFFKRNCFEFLFFITQVPDKINNDGKCLNFLAYESHHILLFVPLIDCAFSSILPSRKQLCMLMRLLFDTLLDGCLIYNNTTSDSPISV